MKETVLRLAHPDGTARIKVEKLDTNRYRIRVDDDVRVVESIPSGPGDGNFRLDSTGARLPFHFAVDPEDGSIWIAAGGRTFRFDPIRPTAGRKARREQASGDLVAPMPGKVVRVEVAPGTDVSTGMTLLVLEAMKMEHSLRAPHAGRVKSVKVATGDMVATGQILVELEETAAKT